MNIISAVKAYVTKMTEESEPGMKALLMDKETTSIVSMVYGQSEILQREVYLLERIDTVQPLAIDRDSGLRYLKCLVFLRPSSQNIALLCRELRNPRYGAYYIYFSNTVSKADIKTLAESDEQEVVKEVQEFYADYLAVGPHLWSVGVKPCLQSRVSWWHEVQHRCSQALVACMLSLRRLPSVIRYQANSQACQQLAQNVNDLIDSKKDAGLFEFSSRQQTSTCLLLIIDRKDDPLTPLLTQWTYQAMVHELLTISNNRVNLSEVPGVSKELKEVVLAAEQDPFYAKNMYLNFGEIGQNIQQLMDEFQKRAKNHQKVESIADMKAFVENYPQFRKLSGSVFKHVTVVGELSAEVSRRRLLELSELEQELASGQSDHSKHLSTIRKLVGDRKIRTEDIARLITIYGLRYEGQANNDTSGLLEALKNRGASEETIREIVSVLEYGSQSNRQGDLFGGGGGAAAVITRRLFKGLSGVDNVYTQHKPLLHFTLDDLIRGKLRESQFPFLGTSQQQVPTDILVFIVGGATYEESMAVHSINKNQGVRIALGTSHIHNSRSFFEEVVQTMRGMPRKNTRYIKHLPVRLE